MPTVSSSRTKRRPLYIIGAVIALAAVAAGYVRWKDPFSSPTSYRLAKIERGPITAVVSATGTLNPVVSVQIGSQVSGQIKELYVDYNSPVKKSQLIARIDPQSFTLRVNQALADVEAARATALTQRANVSALQAELARAKVMLGDAEREYSRNQILHEKNFVSAAVRDKAQAGVEGAREQLNAAHAQLAVGRAQVRNAEAVVKQRESQLSQARVDLERTEIRSPVDGIVVKKSVEPGQTVAASLQAPELFVIAQDLREMQVETSIDESEVGRIRVGQDSTFTVDSFPGRTFRGKVSQIRKAAQVVQNVVTYIAVIRTSNPDLNLFPGMTANVRVIIETRENVLKVPNAALRFRPVAYSEAPSAMRSDSAAAEGDDKGKGAKGNTAQIERLSKELQLTPGQRTKIESILADTRVKIGDARADEAAERRKQAGQARSESRTRIAEVLNAEQRARYEAMGGGVRVRSGYTTSGRVWVPDTETENPKAVTVRIGLTDGTYTELVSGGLHEGADVIVGVAPDAAKSRPSQQPQKGGPRFGF
ncbi:MAG: efflux RND transporter periplasmic adaptor subunit [Burkholderiales bacterium]